MPDLFGYGDTPPPPDFKRDRAREPRAPRDMFGHGEVAPAPDFKGDRALVKTEAPVGDVVTVRLVHRMDKPSRGVAFTPDEEPHCVWLWLPAAQIKIENLQTGRVAWCDVTMPVALAKEHGLS